MTDNKRGGCGAAGLVLIGAFSIAIVLLWSMGSGGATTSAPEPTMHTVKYSVTGNSPQGVRYLLKKPDGGTESDFTHLPINKTLRYEPGSFLYISVQAQGRDARMSCSLTVDGEVVQQSSCNGSYCICSVDGIAR